MFCIFCKTDSTQEPSEEHIIPESMGNIEHVLPLGTVCGKCNQYFSHKIERPLLETPMFRRLRAGMNIPNKRGRLPGWKPDDGFTRPDYRQMSRFLGKVGLEILAFKTQTVTEWNNEIVHSLKLDELRQYVRFNQGPDWPFTVRTLHPANALFQDSSERYEILHEFDILVTDSSEYYSVLSLFGVEFVINLGGRVLDGYRKWLEANEFRSPLYTGKNFASINR